MPLPDMHPEDVKAEIRKRFRSLAAFERAFRLPNKSVTDLMRGNRSKRVADAITSVICRPVSDFIQSESSDLGGSGEGDQAHRLNAEAR